MARCVFRLNFQDSALKRVYANPKSTLINYVGRELGQQVIRSFLGLDPVDGLFTLLSKVRLSASESEPRRVPVLDRNDFLGMELLYASNLATGTVLEKEAVKRTLKQAKSAVLLAEIWLDMLGSALRKGFPIQVSTDRPIFPPSGPKGRGKNPLKGKGSPILTCASLTRLRSFSSFANMVETSPKPASPNPLLGTSKPFLVGSVLTLSLTWTRL